MNISKLAWKTRFFASESDPCLFIHYEDNIMVFSYGMTRSGQEKTYPR
jgi:hypothetical protein